MTTFARCCDVSQSAHHQRGGLHRRTVSLNEQHLDALEAPGYLDPGFRGAGDDETEALQVFIDEHLVR
jgi:hypothetical protein